MSAFSEVPVKQSDGSRMINRSRLVSNALEKKGRSDADHHRRGRDGDRRARLLIRLRPTRMSSSTSGAAGTLGAVRRRRAASRLRAVAGSGCPRQQGSGSLARGADVFIEVEAAAYLGDKVLDASSLNGNGAQQNERRQGTATVPRTSR
jgi:hypothetical protein